MNEEEALEYIKPRLRYYIESTNDNIALSIAVKALEKQIPKKLFVEKWNAQKSIIVHVVQKNLWKLDLQILKDEC